MAVSPGIPTSFVPKQPVQTPRRKISTGTSPFMIGSFVVAGISVLAAGGIFGYQQYLNFLINTKKAELRTQQDAVNQNEVNDYIRLNQRFASAGTLLNNHIMLSHFFDELENVTLQNVQFSDLTITVTGDNTAKVDLNGTAKNFNALAAQSNAIAADPKFKRAIFSNIGFASASTKLQFKLSADLDKTLVLAGNAPAVAPASALPDGTAGTVPVPAVAPVSTGTSTTTSSTTKP